VLSNAGKLRYQAEECSLLIAEAVYHTEQPIIRKLISLDSRNQCEDIGPQLVHIYGDLGECPVSYWFTFTEGHFLFLRFLDAFDVRAYCFSCGLLTTRANGSGFLQEQAVKDAGQCFKSSQGVLIS
jgi:hypothetical protein